MARADVYSLYVLAYATREANAFGEKDRTMASALGCIHGRGDREMLMPSELAAKMREMGAEQPDDSEALRRELEHEKEEREHAQRLLFERCDRDREVRAILEASPDETTATAARRVMAGECDVGPSDRDRRIEAEAHARLSKLILAGGKVETGGRSLYESAGDEIVRLRGEVDGLRMVIRAARDELGAQGDEKLLAAAHRVAEMVVELRSEVEKLTTHIGVVQKEADHDGRLAVRFRRELREAREQGAAEMRERAAAYLDAHAAEDELDGRKREAEVLREIARRVRDIPLSGGPDYGAKVGQAIAGERAAAKIESGVPTREEILRMNPAQQRALGGSAEPAEGLSAEDAETLYGARWTEGSDAWIAPSGTRWLKSLTGYAALRTEAARIRERAAKVPPAASGLTGEAPGGDRAAGGSRSVAEAQGEKQGAGRIFAAKPMAVRAGQRWLQISTREQFDVAALISGGMVSLRNGHRAGMDVDAQTLLRSDDWALWAEGTWTHPATRGPEESPHACATVALPKPPRVEAGQTWTFDGRKVALDLRPATVVHVDAKWADASGPHGQWTAHPSDMLTDPRWTFLGTTPQGPSPKRDEAEPAGCNDILEGRPTTATDEHTDGPTARDAVAGMLLRQGYPGSADDLASGKVSAKDLAAEFRADALVVDESPACIAALDALDRGDLCGARDHVGLAAVISRVAGERDELRRERDEARAEAAALREERDELKADLERWTGRAADLEKQRDEACKDALDAMRELRALKSDASPLRPAEDIAREMVPEPIEQSGSWFVVVRHGGREITLAAWRTRAEVDEDRDDARAIIAGIIERSRAEGKRSAAEAQDPVRDLEHAIARQTGDTSVLRARLDLPPLPAEAPSGMRIERREDGEWLVGASGPPNDCREKADGTYNTICTRHFNGEHISGGVSDASGAIKIDARWPIAPSQDEPPSQVVAESDRIESADGNIVVEMPKDADPRAVLATVAELLGLTNDSVRSLFERNAYRQGVEAGERRTEEKARATARGLVAELARRGTPDAGTWDNFRHGKQVAYRDTASLVRAAFGLPPHGQPPTGGEPAPSESAAGDLDTANQGVSERGPVAAAEPPASAAERWQPGAVWEHMGCRLTLDAAARFSASKDPHVAHFCRRAPVRVSDMTPENGWRYVGRPASGLVPTWSAEPQWSEEERDALWAGEPDHGPYLSPAERAEIDARAAMQQPDIGTPDWTPEDRERARSAVEVATGKADCAIERAHADGIVEGLRVAKLIARRLYDGDQLGGAGLDALAAEIDVDRIASEARRVMVEPAAPDPRALAEQIVPAAVYVNERAPYFGPALRPDGAGVMLTSYFGAEDSRDARAKVVEHVAALLRGAAAKSG
jgi:hypothetical protein